MTGNIGEPIPGFDPNHAPGSVQGVFNEETLHQPTVTVRVYESSVRDGVRQKDLAVYISAKFTRERNTVGSFEVVVPLVEQNRDVLEQIREGWLFEFWSNEDVSVWLFGGYATRLEWGLQDGNTTLTVSGPSYLGWLGQRRIIGGTGSKAWAATLGGLETVGDPPSVNEIAYQALTYDPYSLNPPARAHPSFRIPRVFPITHVDDRFSIPTLPAVYAMPRPVNTEITAFMGGIEVMEYLSELVGDRANEDTTSPWFGMPRMAYDIVRYTGLSFLDGAVTWPSLAIYLLIKVPGLGTNRTVGSNAVAKPVIFDVEAGGVSDASFIIDSGDVRNHVYVLGVGNQATRARYEYEDVLSRDRYGLIEDVVDAGQEGNLNVINQKGKDQLNDKREPKRTAKFSISMIPNQVYGRDFFFDDAVTVYWESIGLVINDFVTSVTLTMGGSDDGSLGIQKTDIVVGSEKLSRDSAILGRYLSGLRRGITNLRI